MAGHAEGESGLEKGWRHGRLETLWRKGQSLHYEQGEIINHEDEGPLVKSYKNVAELVTEMRAEGREYPKLGRQASEEEKITARKSNHQMWNGQRDGVHSQENGTKRKGNSSQPKKNKK